MRIRVYRVREHEWRIALRTETFVLIEGMHWTDRHLAWNAAAMLAAEIGVDPDTIELMSKAV